MTNGDSGFLPGRDCDDREAARGLAGAGDPESRGCRPVGYLRREGPADEGVDGADSREDWAMPLEDRLRSCCLAAADPESTGSGSAGSEDAGSEEGAPPATSAPAVAERTRADLEFSPGFPDVH